MGSVWGPAEGPSHARWGPGPAVDAEQERGHFHTLLDQPGSVKEACPGETTPGVLSQH